MLFPQDSIGIPLLCDVVKKLENVVQSVNNVVKYMVNNVVKSVNNVVQYVVISCSGGCGNFSWVCLGRD